jgi:hypothetical protein
MPKCFSANSGVHSVSPRNWSGETSTKNAIVSVSKTATIPTVVRIDTPAHASRRLATTRSESARGASSSIVRERPGACIGRYRVADCCSSSFSIDTPT